MRVIGYFRKSMHSLDSPTLSRLYKWIFLIPLCSFLIGSAAAGFLWSLDFVTELNFTHSWLLLCLPLLGGFIALMYAKTGPKLGNGNRYIMDAFFKEEDDDELETKIPTLPFLLTPLVLIGTLLTHLGGGSAGREGTAVQMGASLASQLNRWVPLDKSEQRLLTCIGISAGFAAVFGTPLAASIFALEFFSFKKTKWFFVLLCLVAAYLAHFTCIQWGIQHASYNITPFSDYSFITMNWIALAGMIFGLAALLFIQSGKLFSILFSKIKAPLFRPIIGGLIFTAFILLSGQEKMTGLGLPVIQDAFIHQQGSFDFLLKILLTSFILSAGFKGGEVTPLFFIGAVLGTVLVGFIPLPISLLAGLGLIAVFAGATHCLFTAMLLGIELFGIEYAFYFLLVCTIAYLFSGNKSIYEGKPMDRIKQKIAPYFL